MKTVGRNDSCPCGSGKKYKQCCMQRDLEQAAAKPVAAQQTTFKIPRAMQQALAHHEAGQLAEAEALFKQVLEADPHHADALYMLGVMASRAGNNAAAVEFIRKALAASPKNLIFLVNLAIILQQAGQLDEAESLLRRALSIKPDHAEAFVQLGNLLLHRQEKLDEAEKLFRRALLRRPGDAELNFQLGCALQGQRKLAEAEECFKRAIAKRTNYADAHLNLGHLYYEQQNIPLARKHYQAALDIDPTKVAAHLGLSWILNEEGRMEEAKLHYDHFYRQQNIFVSHSKTAQRTVLLISDAGNGNVPFEFLFPERDNNIIKWMVQYATPGQEKDLPPFDMIFNAIGNPDVPLPAQSVVDYLNTCGKPLLNRLENIPRTAREMMPQLFGHIEGACIPALWRIEKPEDWSVITEDKLPILVRPLGTQGGVGLTLIETPEALAEARSRAGRWYVSSYYNYQSPDGYFRKYRIIFVDRKPYPYHLAISEKWLTHYYTANMESVPAKLEEEHRFLQDPAKVLGASGMAAIEAVGRALDLDYAGVDFSVLPDGRILMFEANATMRVHGESEHGVLSFKNQYVARISAAFNQLLRERSAKIT